MIVDYKSKKCWNLISNKIMRLFDSAASEGGGMKFPHQIPPPADSVPQAETALWQFISIGKFPRILIKHLDPFLTSPLPFLPPN
ncbi:MAG: hypothetical protein HOP27_09760 [Anaerolineales bacterium]|nr:hypothetical protein [Anaerolineales bacterium]